MRTAVIYYSFTGKTKALAESQSAQREADLIEVRESGRRGTVGAYVLGSFAAMRQKGAAIEPIGADLDGYDQIVLMAPVWAGNLAPAINSVIRQLPTGKSVEVLAVSASGASKAGEKVRALIQAQGCTLSGFQDVRA